MRKAIIIVGGYNSLWPAYLKLARDLEDLSGMPAVGVPLMPWHWWSLTTEPDIALLLDKLHETVRWARRRWAARRFVLVGHSAGGLLSRLYLMDQPFQGRTYAGLDHVTQIFTLGSPHCSGQRDATDWVLTDRANELVPGAFYVPTVAYRPVAGRFLQGNPHGTYKERRAFRMYRYFNQAGDQWGDGIVPIGSARLDGADPLILEGVAHSRRIHHNWYGRSKDIIRRWWQSEVQ
jgi:hypothetical protein